MIAIMEILHHYIHFGRRSRKVVEEARHKVAMAINASPDEIYFTSCGSESDNLAIKGIMFANTKKGMLTLPTKFDMVDNLLPLNHNGKIVIRIIKPMLRQSAYIVLTLCFTVL